METKMSESTTLIAETEIDLGVAQGVIEDFRTRFTGLTADTPEGYEEVRLALRELTSTRTGVEKARVELKSGFLEAGRTVDRIAKEVTASIVAIEEPLRQSKLTVDNAEADRLKAIEEAKQAVIEAEETAERERLAAEQAAERAKLKAEQEELKAQQRRQNDEMQAMRIAQREAEEAAQAHRAQVLLDQERIAAAHREIEREKEEIEAARLKAIEDARRAEEFAKQKAEYEAAAKRSQAKIDAEAAKAKKQAEAAEKKRKAEMVRLRKERQPDITQLKKYADAIMSLPEPELLASEWATDIYLKANDGLIAVADEIEKAIK